MDVTFRDFEIMIKKTIIGKGSEVENQKELLGEAKYKMFSISLLIESAKRIGLDTEVYEKDLSKAKEDYKSAKFLYDQYEKEIDSLNEIFDLEDYEKEDLLQEIIKNLEK